MELVSFRTLSLEGSCGLHSTVMVPSFVFRMEDISRTQMSQSRE